MELKKPNLKSIVLAGAIGLNALVGGCQSTIPDKRGYLQIINKKYEGRYICLQIAEKLKEFYKEKGKNPEIIYMKLWHNNQPHAMTRIEHNGKYLFIDRDYVFNSLDEIFKYGSVTHLIKKIKHRLVNGVDKIIDIELEPYTQNTK